MKNLSSVILLSVTILFIGLMIGIYVGNANSHNYIDLAYDPNSYTSGEVDPEPSIVKIDLNKATADELTIIPGIGKSTAKKIIDYRTQYGNFYRVDDLTNVKGITEKQIKQLEKYVTVGG